MNTFKKAGVLASLVLVSSFASATTFNLGDLTHTSVDTSTGVITVGAFTDSFDFTLTQDALFSALATSSTTSVSEFTNIEVNGVQGTNYIVGGVFSFSELTEASVGTPVLLGAGSYSLSISGIATNNSTGYTLNTTTTAITSPVPEPSSIALMLGGLGLVGFMAARRKKA